MTNVIEIDDEPMHSFLQNDAMIKKMCIDEMVTKFDQRLEILQIFYENTRIILFTKRMLNAPCDTDR